KKRRNAVAAKAGKDESISSDEEDDVIEKDIPQITEEKDKYANETPDERRVRLAKEYLEKLAAIDSDDDEDDKSENEEDEEDRIESILQLDAVRSSLLGDMAYFLSTEHE